MFDMHLKKIVVHVHIYHTLQKCIQTTSIFQIFSNNYKIGMILSQENVKNVNHDDCRLNFRIFRKTLLKLHHEFGCQDKQVTKFQRDKRIAISLYILGSSAKLRIIRNLFGESTVRSLSFQFTDAVISILLPKYINAYPPTENKIN